MVKSGLWRIVYNWLFEKRTIYTWVTVVYTNNSQVIEMTITLVTFCNDLFCFRCHLTLTTKLISVAKQTNKLAGSDFHKSDIPTQIQRIFSNVYVQCFKNIHFCQLFTKCPKYFLPIRRSTFDYEKTFRACSPFPMSLKQKIRWRIFLLYIPCMLSIKIVVEKFLSPTLKVKTLITSFIY